MTLQEKFKLIFESGNWFIFENTIKRQDGEWVDRITWEHVGQPGNRHIKSCEWFGFETIEECVDDCLNYIETIKDETDN